ncbi:unnamed protein product [Hymenolepis diminuta]|uniref:Uncharacterized protein n=1 Tax=Hymenolepis diminuta TaxID=6216 RepID=A0A564Z887_HYMDI|nr:unnamed protein product [Hymenolepis diminuta]
MLGSPVETPYVASDIPAIIHIEISYRGHIRDLGPPYSRTRCDHPLRIHGGLLAPHRIQNEEYASLLNIQHAHRISPAPFWKLRLRTENGDFCDGTPGFGHQHEASSGT